MKQITKNVIIKIKETKDFMKEQKEQRNRFKQDLHIKHYNEYEKLGSKTLTEMTAKEYARYQVLSKKFAKNEQLVEDMIVYVKMNETY